MSLKITATMTTTIIVLWSSVFLALCSAEEVLWSHEATMLEQVIMLRPFPSPAAPGVASNHDAIFFVDALFNVNKVNRSSGALLWSMNPFNRTEAAPNELDQVTLLASGSTLVVANYSYLFGVDEQTGSILWQQHLSDLISPTPHLSDNHLIIVVAYQTVRAFDAESGSVQWTHLIELGCVSSVGFTVGNEVAVRWANCNDNGTQATILLDAATGNVTLSMPGAVNCNHLTHSMRYLACATPTSANSTSPAGDAIPVDTTVIALATKETLWQQYLGAAPAFQSKYSFHVLQDEKTLLIVAVGAKNKAFHSWAAAVNIVSGGTPLWNVSIPWSDGVSMGPTVVEFQGMLILAGSSFYVIRPQNTKFVFLDSATGATVLEFKPPTNRDMAIATIGDNMLFPNLMGWSRWTHQCQNSNGTNTHTSSCHHQQLSMQFHQLDQFEGMLALLTEPADSTNTTPPNNSSYKYTVVSGGGITAFIV